MTAVVEGDTGVDRRWAAPTLGVLLALAAGASGTARESPQTAPAAETAPGPSDQDQATLTLALSGNRNFCVTRNEVDIKAGSLKPRQYRNAPLVTTYGYKYQISANRRGTTAILKLLESPVIRTAYAEPVRHEQALPQPHIPTEKELKDASQPFQAPKKVPRWIPENTCTLLQPEYSFPLAPGRYDIYLGFDVMASNGQWSPLQSDFLTDVILEKGQVTRVDGRVDYTNGVRTVKLESFQKPALSEKR